MPSGRQTLPRRAAIESILRRDRALVISALTAVVLMCWLWIIPMARDMYGPMNGPSAWMMTSRWDATHILLLFAMWTAMMVGMMLPSAAPTLLLYTNVVRKSVDGADARSQVYAFAAGYILVWTLFSVGATFLQRLLGDLLLLSPMMELRSRIAGSVLFAVAGVYQLTPMKRSCLESCSSPAEFIVRHWRPGGLGALRMGVTHGLLCLGCCWALMLLLFVGGVMNLIVIATLTVFVLIEKIASLGARWRTVSAVVLFAAAVWTIAR